METRAILALLRCLLSPTPSIISLTSMLDLTAPAHRELQYWAAHALTFRVGFTLDDSALYHPHLVSRADPVYSTDTVLVGRLPSVGPSHPNSTTVTVSDCSHTPQTSRAERLSSLEVIRYCCHQGTSP